MPDEPDPWVGVVLDDRYRVLQRLAQGSMGAVYRGERVPLGRPVAIKLLHQSFVQDPEFLGRFDREIRVMSKLAHPNCVSVIDLGAKPTPYVVMDFIDGHTLQEMLEDGALPVARAIDLIRQVLAGLAHAHQQNIVHRDIKPANVMVTQEIGKGDHARILDFGLAMLRSGASSVATQHHIVVGTPAYMSPEQTMGSKVGPASDIYSTGVVLFELLTGEKPFIADDTFELLGKHRSAPVPRLHEVAGGRSFPPGLQSIIDTAMAKDPGHRFGSAIEFADALAQVAEAGDVAMTPTRASTPLPLRGSGSQPAIPPAVDGPAGSQAAGHPWREKVTSRRGLGFFGALLLVAGAAIATWQVSARWHKPDDGGGRAPVAATTGRDAGVTSAQPAYDGGAIPEPPLAAFIPDAAVATGAADAAAGPPDASLPDAAPTPVEPSGDPAAEEPASAGAESPVTPDVAPPSEPEVIRDEASPPPAPAPPPPPAARPVKSIGDALALARTGHRDLAIDGLRELWRKNKQSGYLPYHLGNLYFDKGWWRTGLDHYWAAITNERGLRDSPGIIANAIRALAFSKPRAKAMNLLLRKVGRAALPALKRAASKDRNANVRKYAAYLAKKISRYRR